MAAEPLSTRELQIEPAVGPEVAAIVQQFITQYYQMFDTNRASLVSLYLDQSKLTFEGATFTGPQKIIAKLMSLSFQQVQHAVTTFDPQVTVDNGILVFVIGQLVTDNDPPKGFSQVFYLKQVGDSMYVLNDLFRLALHHT